MKPSDRIKERIEELFDEARDKNLEAQDKGMVGGYVEDKDFYTIRAIIDCLDEVYEAQNENQDLPHLPQ